MSLRGCGRSPPTGEHCLAPRRSNLQAETVQPAGTSGLSAALLGRRAHRALTIRPFAGPTHRVVAAWAKRRKSNTMLLYVGAYWAEDHHDVQLMNEAGQQLDSPGACTEGVEQCRHAARADRAARLGPRRGPGLHIETDRGPWVSALLTAGYRVYAINPRTAARYLDLPPRRRRHDRQPATPSCSPSSPAPSAAQPPSGAPATSSTQARCGSCVRAHQQLIWDRVRQTNRLRSALLTSTSRAHWRPTPVSRDGDALGALATARGRREAAATDHHPDPLPPADERQGRQRFIQHRCRTSWAYRAALPTQLGAPPTAAAGRSPRWL